MPDDGHRPEIPRWVDAASDAFYLVDGRGRMVDATERGCSRLGYTLDELRLLYVWNVQVEIPDLAGWLERFGASEEDQIFSVHGEHRRKDQSTFPVDVRVRRVSFDGQPFFVASARDVSEERALRLSETTLRAIYEHAPSIIATTDLNGYITTTNKTLPELTIDQVVGRPLSKFLDPSLQHEIDQKLALVAISGEPVAFEVRAGPPGGPYRWLHSRVAPVKDDDTVTSLVHIVDDITEERVIREALSESEARFRYLVDQLPDGVLVVGANLTILQSNEHAAEALGYTRRELEGKRLDEITLDFSRELLGDILGSPASATDYSAVQQRCDGSTFPVEVRASSFEQDGEWRMLAVVRDVSDRQTVERAALEAAASERAQIGAVLHDELGQKLAGARYLANALAERLVGSGDPDREEEAREIVKHVGDAITRVRELERGLAPVGVGSDELLPALEELCSSTGRLFGVQCEFCSDALPNGIDDSVATGLYQIAREAVMNAVEHAAPRRINVTLELEDDALLLDVVDDGSGIPPAAERRFGTGIRLMTSRALAIGGTLTLRNTTPGTRVAFVFRR